MQLLAASTGQTWRAHVTGAASIVYQGGPERYNTELETSLFLSNVEQIVSQNLFSPEFPADNNLDFRGNIKQQMQLLRSAFMETAPAIHDSGSLTCAREEQSCHVADYFDDCRASSVP